MCARFNQYQANACACKHEGDSREEFEWAIKHFFQTINKAPPKNDDLSTLLDRWGGNAENRSEIVQALARTHQLKKYKFGRQNIKFTSKFTKFVQNHVASQV